MYHKVVTSFCVDEMGGSVPCIFKKIGHEVFVKFLGFGFFDIIDELYEIFFERLDV